jgi:hypothetical protein
VLLHALRLAMHRLALPLILFGLLACEPPPPASQLEIELLGCVDEPHPMDTCADFCEWDGATCAENACDGITARSFPVGDACVQDTVEMSTNTPLGCEDVLVFDDEHTYYDCCCDYR